MTLQVMEVVSMLLVRVGIETKPGLVFRMYLVPATCYLLPATWYLHKRLMRSFYHAKDVSNPNHGARFYRAVMHLNSYNMCIE